METLEALGGETWFRLGDEDLALHVERTRRLKGGETLSAFVADVARRLGIEAAIVPMSDDPVRTRVGTATASSTSRTTSCAAAARRRCTALAFEGAARARLAPAALAALADPPRSRRSSCAPRIPT